MTRKEYYYMAACPAPDSLKGFAFIALATAVAILVVRPVIETAFQAVFKKSAENVVSFGRAA